MIVPSPAVLAFVSLLVTVLSGFAAVMMKLGQIQTQLALLWAWYLAECGPGVPGGRRRTDPPAHFPFVEPPAPISGPGDATSPRQG
jgi:hypothetical protein